MTRTVGAIMITVFLGFTAFAQQETPEERQIRFADGLLKREYYEDAAKEYRAYIADYADGAYIAVARYRLGESLYGAGEVEAAANTFQQFIAAHPESGDVPMAQLRRAECLARLGRGLEAIPVFNDLLKNANDIEVRAGAAYQLGKVHVEEGNIDAALEAFGAFQGELKDTAIAPFGRFQLAAALEEKGELARAAETYEVAARSLPEVRQSEALSRAASLFERAQAFDRAATLLKQAAENASGETAKVAAARLPWVYIAAEDYAAARNAVDAFAKRFPDERLGEMALIRGRALQGSGDVEGAATAYREAVSNTAGEIRARAHYRLASIAKEREDFDAAADLANAAISDAVDSPEWAAAGYLLLGEVLAAKEDINGAIAAFHTVQRDYADTQARPAAIFHTAKLQEQQANLAAAVEHYDTLVRDHAESPYATRAEWAAADALFRNAQFDEAAGRFASIVARDDESMDSDVIREATMRAAGSYYNAGNSTKAREWYAKAAKAYAGDPQSAEINVRLGELFLGEDAGTAEEHFNRALKASPDSDWAGRANAGLGLALYERGDHDAAAKALLAVVRDHPDIMLSRTAYAWLGQRLFTAGEFESAANVFGALVENYPEDPRRAVTALLLGRALSNTGQAKEAEKAFTIAVELDAGAASLEAQYRRGLLHERDERFAEALKDYVPVAESDNSYSAIARLGWARVAHKQKLYEEAVRNYMLVAVLYADPEVAPYALNGAAVCYEASGDTERAQKTRAELKRDYPEFVAPDDPAAIPEAAR